MSNEASSTSSGDFDVFKSLWSNINDAVAPSPPQGVPAKACLLLESPGFSINPDAYDFDKFNPGTMDSPDYVVSKLVDRVPSLAAQFYDTGSHISFYWNQLLTTFELEAGPDEDKADLKERYDKAIEMLYGGPEGYQKLQKTELFKNQDTLRDEWQKAKQEQNEFWRKCQQEDKGNWPRNYQQNATPYLQKVKQAFTQYSNLTAQIDQYQAAIFQYTRGDLTTVLQNQDAVLGQNKQVNAGGDGGGGEFFKVTLEPDDWWKLFPEAKDDNGWTSVEVTQQHLYQSSHDSFTKVGGGLNVGFAGLFNISGGADREKGTKSLTKEGSNLKISFKIRKVSIRRPWFETAILQYPTIGIKGMPAGKWSTGELDPSKNKGDFPLLPTDMVLAKDIEIHADSFTETAEEKFSKLTTKAGANATELAGMALGIGPFSIGGDFHSDHGSTDTKSSYDGDSRTLKVTGTQIIGWVCTVIPRFPSFEKK